MADLWLPGLATGIDTKSIVAQLMVIESQRLARYQVKKAGYEEQETAFTALRSKISATRTAVSALSDADDLQIFTTTSSDTDILTVSSSSDANPGSHSIEIDQLATGETWIQDTSTFSYETDYVGGGSFIYSYNHIERVITAVAGETTLEDFVGLINNDVDNPGVTANLLYQGDKYHLMLSGQETGEDYQISVNASTTEVWASSTEGGSFTKDGEVAGLTTKITELDEFNENSGLQGDEFITIGDLVSSKNHFGTDLPDSTLDITANTTVAHLIDAINEHFDGVATARFEDGEIYLTDHISGTSGLEIDLDYDAGSGDTALTLPTMAVSTEGGSTSESLALLGSSSFIETQDAQGSKIKMDGYPSSTTAELQTLTLDSVATSGHFHLTYKGETTADIAYDASTTDIKDALELLSTVSTGDITVGGTGLDQAGNTTFQFLAAAGDVEMISIDATALTGPTTTTIAETTKGNDGWLSRNRNSIADALTGVTLNLHDVTTDPIEVTITRNRVAIVSKIMSMITAYNELTSFLVEKTEYNDETEEMGILSTNFGVSFIKSQIRSPFFGLAPGFDDDTDTFLQASDIGLTVDHHGVMELDSSEFNDAVNEDFKAVIDLLGAVALGSSDSDTIEFYAASEKYTTAGTYDIEVTIASNLITGARIKLSSEGESDWRNAEPDYSSDVVRGDSTFTSDGYPLYPENGLTLSVDTSVSDGTYTATVRVKQGVAGALEQVLDDTLKAEGRLDIGVEFIENRIRELKSRIESEEDRLEDVQERLIQKFARLERTLTALQQQMSTVSTLTQITFGALYG
jgi:flagellar hook-associated protein 2